MLQYVNTVYYPLPPKYDGLEYTDSWLVFYQDLPICIKIS